VATKLRCSKWQRAAALLQKAPHPPRELRGRDSVVEMP
jgi:hypothetical protein